MPTVEVTVKAGEYARIPKSPKHVLIGPGKLSVTRRPDGTVYGHIVAGQPSPIILVGKRHLKCVEWGI